MSVLCPTKELSPKIGNTTGELTKDYLNDVTALIDRQLSGKEGPLVIYFESGHFNTRYGVDDFSISSFNDSVTLGSYLIKKYKKSVKLAYGILVDDLSLACSTDTVCTLPTADTNAKNAQDLPAEIEALIESSSLLKRERYLVFSERTAKNRAINTLRKKIKTEDSNLVIQSAEDAYEDIVMTGEGNNDILLCKRTEQIYNIRCPGILGQHYADVLQSLQKRYLDAKNFLIIDWSEVCDKSKVVQGVMAARSVFIDEKNDSMIEICNIFFADDEGEFVQIDTATLNKQVVEEML